MIKIKELRINRQIDPTGIEKVEEFSWKLESDGPNMVQKSYEIEVSYDENFAELLYKSGEIIGQESVHIKCTDWSSELESVRKYYIKVRVKMQNGEVSEWKKGCFVTALLDSSEWKGKFVSPENEEQADKSRGYYLRKNINITGNIKSAYALVSSLGLYHFYINGQKAGDDEFTPGWTSYNHHLMYQMYDVTEYLREGMNTVGALLGAGWYKGDMGSARTRNHYGKRCAFSGQIEVFYEDGRRDTFITDSSWKWKNSPVLFSEIYDGEVYDARLETKNWNTYNISDSDWKKAEYVEFDPAVLCAQSSCKPKIKERFSAKKILTTPQGDTVVDFGQNLAGWIELKVKGVPGARVELNCFEALDKDGNVYLENLRTAKATIVYICGSDQEEVYHPNFSFQGFRYARIAEYPGEPQAEDFTACAIYSDMESRGTFKCSDQNVNQLHHNILWGMKGNFLDVPTDCPQRDERLGWTGDAQIFCRTASYLMDTDIFYRKWLQDVREEQTEEGGIPHVVPDVWTGKNVKGKIFEKGTHSAAAWADAVVIIPWILYQMFGDKIVIYEQYESMKAWIDFMHKYEKNGSWEYRMQFGDWIALDAEEGSYYGATPLPMTNLAYYVYSTGLFCRMAEIIGKRDDVECYQKLYQRIRNSYIKQYFTDDGHLKIQTQTAQIISLYFDLIPEKYRKNVVADLLRLLQKENGHLVTGFVGTPYFCQVLSDNGHVKEAYELLLKDDFPSWLYQVKMGATTVWEHWDGIRPNGSMWSPAMNSFNHYAYGAVGEWLYRSAAGIECVNEIPGFRKILLKPCIGEAFDFVDASYESDYGTIKSRWEKQDEKVIIYFDIPCNTTAEIRLYNAENLINTSGLKFSKSKDAQGFFYTAETGSGNYCVEYTWTK